MHTQLSWRVFLESSHSEDQGDWRIMLCWLLGKHVIRMGCG